MPAGGFVHQAHIYDSEQEFLAAAVPFARAGIGAEEAVLARVKASNAEALLDALGGDAYAIDIDAGDGYFETPARTRSKLLDWTRAQADGGRVRVLGEAPWPLSSPAGVREWARHEAVINLAFAGLPVTFACPYDAGGLPPSIIEHAEHTHPEIVRAGSVADSPVYADPRDFCSALNDAAPALSGSPAAELAVEAERLSSLRELVQGHAWEAGVAVGRIADIVLAVDEVATNALVHGAEPAVVRVWREPGEIVFEVSDSGAGIHDPVAGQLVPSGDAAAGRGLWTARQLCDSVEFRRNPSGVAVTLHITLPDQV
jgi:anti-sigma regulatory factor (Ser/Thr protein kinase)